jgi:hypothetical protein
MPFEPLQRKQLNTRKDRIDFVLHIFPGFGPHNRCRSCIFVVRVEGVQAVRVGIPEERLRLIEVGFFIARMGNGHVQSVLACSKQR